MDRITVYSGEVPRTVDILQSEQNTMVALAKLSNTVIGNGGFVEGLALTPGTGLTVSLSAGQVYQLASLEATAYSALPADTSDQIVKQGIALQAQTISLTPPSTSGFSQVFLIEVAYEDLDSGSTVLPYYNSANPAAPFSGPGNSGTPQNTTRKGTVQVQVKAGTAATTGTQVAPSADSGFIGLWLVTLANGAVNISSGNIVQVANAPFIGSAYMPKLPAIPSYVQSGAPVFCVDTGSVNAFAVAPIPPPASIVAGMELKVKAANANTGACTMTVTLAGGGTVNANVVHSDSSALVSGDVATNQIMRLTYDGTNWQMPTISLQPVPSGTEVAFTGLTAPSGWLLEAGQAISRTTFAGLFNAITTTTTGTPAASSSTITGVSTNLVGLGVEGAFIEGVGISTGTTIVSVTSNTITLSANAVGGSAGETLRILPFGQGDASTTFTVPDRRGVTLFGRDNMGGTAKGLLSLSTSQGILGTKLNATGGEQAHQIVITEVAPHTHSVAYFGTAGVTSGGTSVPQSGSSASGSTGGSGSTSTGGTGAAAVAHNTVPPAAITNYIIKT